MQFCPQMQLSHGWQGLLCPGGKWNLGWLFFFTVMQLFVKLIPSPLAFVRVMAVIVAGILAS